MKSAIGSAALRLQRCPRVRAPPPEAGRREGRRRGRRPRPRRGCGLRRTQRPIRSSDVFSRSLLINLLALICCRDSRLVEKFRFPCKATKVLPCLQKLVYAEESSLFRCLKTVQQSREGGKFSIKMRMNCNFKQGLRP